VMDSRGGCRDVGHLFFPESSPGLLYDVATRHVGFRLGDEGKTMGLAPYGRSDLFSALEPQLHLHDDGSFTFMPHEAFRTLLQSYVPERECGEPITERHRNVAFAGQALLERIVCNAFAAA